MTEPTIEQLGEARALGQEAGDQRAACAFDNPYDVATQRALQDAWEEGRQDGIFNH